MLRTVFQHKAKIFFSPKSRAGFSVVEGLVATGVVALSILAIGAVVSQSSKVVNSAQIKQELPGVVTDSLNRARMVMLETMDPVTNQRINGICGMLEPQAVAPGVVPIYLVIARSKNPDSTKLYSEITWKNAFAPDWKLSGYKVDDRGGIEFVLVPEQGNSLIPTASVDPLSVRIQMKISLRSMDPTQVGQVFGEISNNVARIDAKKAVYMLNAKTSYEVINSNGTRTPGESFGADLVSVIDIGSCDVKDANGRTLALSPAGTGVGDPAGLSIYNNSEFKDPGQAPFEIILATREVVEGRNINGRLSANPERNVVSACTESTFRCPKAKQARTYRPFINLTAHVNYFAQNQYGYRDRARVIPKFELRDSSGRDISPRFNGNDEYTIGTSIQYRQHSDSLYYPLVNNNLDLNAPMTMAQGMNRIIATIGNAEPMCRSLCQPNYKGSITPTFSLMTPDLRDGDGRPAMEMASAPMPLHCTMCYVKGCTRIGPETFGTIEKMPEEPLDAQIPECAAQDEDSAKQMMPFNNQPVSGSGACIAAKIVGGKLQYFAKNCSENLPVMCFAFGQYTFARSLATKNIVNVNFDGAADACRNLGRESVSARNLQEAITRMGGDASQLAQIPVVNGRNEFLNLSKVGTFIAPQSNEDIEYAVESLKVLFPQESSGQEFWVGLRKEAAGIVADIPKAKLTNGADEKHFVYFTAAGVLTHRVVNETPHSFVKVPSSPADVAHVLFNHAKFRGVATASKEQTRSLPFLCMKRSDKSFFISSRVSSDFSSGGVACENEGGLFVAPHSPKAWLHSMLLVEQHSTYLPFPDFTSSPNSAWVALEGNNMNPALYGEFAKLLSLPDTEEEISDNLVDANGVFIKIKSTQKLVKIVEELTEEQKKNPPPPKYEWVPNPDVKLKVACYSPGGLHITIRNLGGGCESDEIRVTESNIKSNIISLVWILKKNSFDLGNLEFIKIK